MIANAAMGCSWALQGKVGGMPRVEGFQYIPHENEPLDLP